MTSANQSNDNFFHTYKRLPLAIHHGEGMYLIADDGTRYLDFLAGVGVNVLGHRHPKVLSAMHEQIDQYIHLSNYFTQQPQARLAEILIQQSGFASVFFCNSGTEAIEGALKIARKWGALRNKKEIVSFSNAFHGRTFGALSLMDRPKYRDGFEPLLPNFRITEFNQCGQLRSSVTIETAAVVLECIQGEGGIRPISQDFVDELHSLQSQYGFLIIADEIQSGIGRTGKFFSFSHFALRPDLITLAKPLGGGLPLGAILGNDRVSEILQPGSHGSTFGGNPVACAAGTAVIEEIISNGFLDHVRSTGNYFFDQLELLRKDFPLTIKEVRGTGLMSGVELVGDAEPIVTSMREKNILINGTDQTVLRFLPPLIAEPQHVDLVITALRNIFVR